jgi:signal transduction histidine kinase
VVSLLWLPLRVLPLLVTAAYLAVLHGPTPVTGLDWVLGLGSAMLTGIGGWVPLTATAAQSALLSVGLWGVAQTAMPMVFILTMITVGELWLRRGGWSCWAGTAAFAGAQVALYAPHFHPVLSTASVVVTTGPPVLLGVYIRSVLRTALDAERRRDEAVRDARFAERTAIARELHDLVAHHMASIAVRVGAARHALGGADTRVDEALFDAHTTARAALTDLKRLMTVLRDPATMHDETGATVVDTGGLTTAIATAVARTRAAGVTVDAEVDAGIRELGTMQRLAVLRVVQEGLTNVVKHAGEHPHASLVVRAGADAVRIAVHDDGPGALTGKPGFGLVGMRERVELLGGSMHAGGRSLGWSLEVAIPTGGEP